MATTRVVCCCPLRSWVVWVGCALLLLYAGFVARLYLNFRSGQFARAAAALAAANAAGPGGAVGVGVGGAAGSVDPLLVGSVNGLNGPVLGGDGAGSVGGGANSIGGASLSEQRALQAAIDSLPPLSIAWAIPVGGRTKRADSLSAMLSNLLTHGVSSSDLYVFEDVNSRPDARPDVDVARVAADWGVRVVPHRITREAVGPDGNAPPFGLFLARHYRFMFEFVFVAGARALALAGEVDPTPNKLYHVRLRTLPLRNASRLSCALRCPHTCADNACCCFFVCVIHPHSLS
jgi:hypothetical protein